MAIRITATLRFFPFVNALNQSARPSKKFKMFGRLMSDFVCFRDTNEFQCTFVQGLFEDMKTQFDSFVREVKNMSEN